MKKILLASVALTAFAGAAAAEVSFGGDAEFGYNDDFVGGYYYSLGLTLKASQELDNGLTASMSADLNFDDDGELISGSGDAFAADDLVFSVSNDQFSLTVGDTEYSAVEMWSGVTNMETDYFTEVGDDHEDAVIKATGTMGGVTVSVSGQLDDEGDDYLNMMSYGVTADLGDVTVGLVGQKYDGDTDGLLGLFASTTIGGVDLKLAYSEDQYWDESSTGIEATYAMGDVTLTGFYVSESDYDDNYGMKVAYAANGLSVSAFVHDGNDEDRGIDVAYDMGNGLELFAGDSLDDGSYVAAEYDLGGGAGLTVAFGDDDGNDEIGPNEYMDGTTVELSFAF